jgi:hypothetical protein
MESRRLVVWISAGILGFQGATLAFDRHLHPDWGGTYTPLCAADRLSAAFLAQCGLPAAPSASTHRSSTPRSKFKSGFPLLPWS